MVVRLLAILVGVLVGTSASAGLDPETVKRFSNAIVQTIVDGTLSNDDKCELRGTGFFIDKMGHILTAAHNVLPCSEEGDLGPRLRWKSTPSIEVQVFSSNPGPEEKSKVKKVKAVIIYADEQTDLALLRADVTDTYPLPLAPSGTLKAGMSVSVMTFEEDKAEPSDRPVKIDSLFNPSEQHKGLIDISGPDIKKGASGGPLFDESSYVAGVFTRGRKETGEGVVPIAYASSLFSMCGVSYPSDEVREVIEELGKDIIHWLVKYEQSTGNVTVSYYKRLKVGSSPYKFKAVFDVYTSKGFFGGYEYGLNFEDTVIAKPTTGKKGLLVFEGIGQKIDEAIMVHNEHIAANPGDGKKLRKKSYALVTIEAEFVNGQRIIGVRDYRLRF